MLSPYNASRDVVLPIDRHNPVAMVFNGSSYNINGGVRILIKTLTEESVGIIEDLKSNKTTDIIDVKVVQITFCILYTIIFVLGVFGSVLVCFVVFRNRAMQTVTNLFITNLALSDILLCIFAVPLTPMYTFLGRWVFGRLLCHLMPYAQGTSVYISTLTLTSIAIDRFFVIIYPFHPRMKLNTCIFIIVCIWMFSLVVTCPYGLFMGIVITNNETYYCEESWPSDRSRKIFGVCTTILQFLIPFLVIALCYTCVSIRLANRARTKPGAKNARREEADRDRKKRTNRMLISMVAIFGISWLPLNLINIFNDFNAQMTEWNYYFVSFFLAHSMAMASTCYNPFLYAWLNENFRKEFKQVLPFLKSTGGVSNSYHAGRMPMAHNDKKNICDDKTMQDTIVGASFNREPLIQHRMDIGVEVETILVKDKMISATFHTRSDNVNLRLIDKVESLESQASKPIKKTST